MKLKILFIILLCIPITSHCCSGGFKHGFGLSLSELIDNSSSIVLVRFSDNKDQIINFDIEKVIKDDSKASINEEMLRFVRIVSSSHKKFSKNHKSEDFNGHTDAKFWANENKLQKEIVSRVLWKGGMCTPVFTFESDETYLLFLDSPGSFYAAEIIKSEEDEWLNYVVKRIKSTK